MDDKFVPMEKRDTAYYQAAQDKLRKQLMARMLLPRTPGAKAQIRDAKLMQNYPTLLQEEQERREREAVKGE
jgi:hypothetical protein